jgi:probable HAF family extracellular repeat protein
MRQNSQRQTPLTMAAFMLVSASMALASPPLFNGMGRLPGGTASGATGISANGTFVVGYCTLPQGDRAIRWSRTTGMQSLGVLPGGLSSRAVAVSADGSKVAGYGHTPAGDRAFRWTLNGGLQSLGTLPGGTYSIAGDISNDGSVIVGYSNTIIDDVAQFRAFRWNAGTGAMEDLGLMPGGSSSYGQGVSGDGSIVIGVGDADNLFDFRAFRHESGVMTNLGTISDVGKWTIALGCSDDGRAVVGYGRVLADVVAFRWTPEQGMLNLGKFPGSDNTIARAVSADGNVVVGGSAALAGDVAFIWTKKLGLTDLNTYLRARGINLTGWTLTTANAVSNDGLTIAGVGFHNGVEEGWVAFLGQGQDLTAIEQLGKSLMSDPSLSNPAGQSCISCHSAGVGFSNPRYDDNAHGAVHEGAVLGLFGNRKPPTAAYAGQSPPLFLDGDTWTGGMFFDGRAAGWTMGDPLAEQALAPFLNPVEMNNASAEEVVAKVATSNYAALFRDVWGPGSLPGDGGDATLAYQRVGLSIAAYERSREVNPFNSKYDDYLAGRVTLTRQELNGLALFNGRAGCVKCHPSDLGPNGEPPLFTDFTYDNIGMPANPENPFYDMPDWVNPDGRDFADPGLGGFLQRAGYPKSVFGPEMGKHKVPTLRNIDRRGGNSNFVKAYGHNGFFKSLEEIVHFYNTRDSEAWPPPEVPQNVNIAEMGNLHLTPDEEAALVAFLRTLSDREVDPAHCPADFDHDGFVNGNDFDLFAEAFDQGSPGADFDRNGFVNGTDFDLFALSFEEGC